VLREIFGSEREEMTGDWRRLHNEELSDLYCSLGTGTVRWRVRWVALGSVGRRKAEGLFFCGKA
jgi:hypothetical protein